MDLHLRKPTLTERAYAASVFAAIAFALVEFGLFTTEQQLAATLVTTSICGLPVKIPTTPETSSETEKP